MFSKDREVALRTKVARMLVWVNILLWDGSGLVDRNVLVFIMSYCVYIWERGEHSDFLGFPSWLKNNAVIGKYHGWIDR